MSTNIFTFSKQNLNTKLMDRQGSVTPTIYGKYAICLYHELADSTHESVTDTIVSLLVSCGVFIFKYPLFVIQIPPKTQKESHEFVTLYHYGKVDEEIIFHFNPAQECGVLLKTIEAPFGIIIETEVDQFSVSLTISVELVEQMAIGSVTTIPLDGSELYEAPIRCIERSAQMEIDFSILDRPLPYKHKMEPRYKEAFKILHVPAPTIIGSYLNKNIITKRSLWWSVLTEMQFKPQISKYLQINKIKNKKEIRFLTKFSFCSKKEGFVRYFIYNDFQVTTQSARLIQILLDNGWEEAVRMSQGLISNLTSTSGIWFNSFCTYIRSTVHAYYNTDNSEQVLKFIKDNFATILAPVLKIVALFNDPGTRWLRLTTILAMFSNEILSLVQPLFGAGKLAARKGLEELIAITMKVAMAIFTNSSQGSFNNLAKEALGCFPDLHFQSMIDFINKYGNVSRNLQSCHRLIMALFEEIKMYYYKYVLKEPYLTNFDTRSMQIWISKASSLLKTLNTPDKIGFPLTKLEFISVLNTRDEYHNLILKNPELSRSQTFSCSLFINALEALIKDRAPPVTSKVSKRNPPFIPCFFGESGIGKSTMQEIYIREIASILGFSTMSEDDLIFYRNSENNFLDGYGNQPIVVVDDAFKLLDSKDWSELITWGNRAPAHLHMANIKDKANCFFQSDVLIYTCGKHPATYESNPILQGKDAPLRRMNMVVEIVQNSKHDPNDPTSKWSFRIHDKFIPDHWKNSRLPAMDYKTFILYTLSEMTKFCQKENELTHTLYTQYKPIIATCKNIEAIVAADFSKFLPNPIPKKDVQISEAVVISEQPHLTSTVSRDIARGNSAIPAYKLALARGVAKYNTNPNLFKEDYDLLVENHLEEDQIFKCRQLYQDNKLTIHNWKPFYIEEHSDAVCDLIAYMIICKKKMQMVVDEDDDTDELNITDNELDSDDDALTRTFIESSNYAAETPVVENIKCKICVKYSQTEIIPKMIDFPEFYYVKEKRPCSFRCALQVPSTVLGINNYVTALAATEIRNNINIYLENLGLKELCHCGDEDIETEFSYVEFERDCVGADIRTINRFYHMFSDVTSSCYRHVLDRASNTWNSRLFAYYNDCKAKMSQMYLETCSLLEKYTPEFVKSTWFKVLAGGLLGWILSKIVCSYIYPNIAQAKSKKHSASSAQPFEDYGEYLNAKEKYRKHLENDPYVNFHGIHDEAMSSWEDANIKRIRAAGPNGVFTSHAQFNSTPSECLLNKLEKIKQNIFKLSSVDGSKYLHGCILVGRLAVIPHHFFECLSDDKFYLNFTTNPNDRLFCDKTTYRIIPILYRDSPTDFSIIEFKHSQFQRKKSIINHYITEKEVCELKHFPGALISSEGLRENTLRSSTMTITGAVSYSIGNREFELPRAIDYQIHTINGQCGGPIIHSNSNTYTIIGHHLFGIEQIKRGGGGVLTKDMITATLRNAGVSQMSMMEPSPVIVETTYAGVISDKSGTNTTIPNYIAGSMQFAGKIDKMLCNNVKNQIEHSPIYGWSGGLAQTAPAILDGKTKLPNGEEVTIKQKAVYKMSKIVPNVDGILLSACFTSYISKIQPQLSGARCAELHKGIFSLEKVVFGDSKQLMNSTNVSSSLGGWWVYTHPHLHDKKTFINLDTKFISQELIDKVNSRIEAAKKYESYPVLCIDVLKTERRSLEKVAEANTRVFNNMDFDFNLVGLMYFGAFINHMKATRIFNESIVGIKYGSLEWNVLARKLTQHKKMFDGDIGKFDASMIPDIMYMCLNVINWFYRVFDSNFKPEDEVVRNVIFSQIVLSLRCCNNILYYIDHGNSSGNFITTLLNSIYLSITYRYIFGCIHRSEDDIHGTTSIKHFNKEVVLVVNGDDSIISVSDDVAKVFNPKKINETFMCELGTTFTDGNKSDVFEWKDITTVNILKRGFRFDPDFMIYVAALKLDVILETSWWCKKNEMYPFYMSQVARGTLLELCLHDKEIYNKYSKLFLDTWFNSELGELLIEQPNRQALLMSIKNGETPDFSFSDWIEDSEVITESCDVSTTKDDTVVVMNVSCQMAGGEVDSFYDVCASKNIGYISRQPDLGNNLAQGWFETKITENQSNRMDDGLSNNEFKQNEEAVMQDVSDIKTYEMAPVRDFIDSMSLDPIGSCGKVDLKTTDYLTRPTTETFNLATTNLPGAVLYSKILPDTSNTLWNELLNRFGYYRYDVEFEITTTCSPASSGGMIFWWDPNYGETIPTLAGASSRPHVILDFGSKLPVKITVPYVGITHVHGGASLGYRWSEFKGMIYSALRTDIANARVSVTYRLKNITLLSPVAQMENNSTSNVEAIIKQSKGLLSTSAKLAGVGLEKVGYDKEANHGVPTPMFFNPTRFLSTTNGIDNSIVADSTSFPSVSSDRKYFQTTSSGGDDCDFETLSNLPSYFDQAQWDATDSQYSLLNMFPVTPFLCSKECITADTYIPSRCGSVAALFTIWRCDVKFHIRFFKSIYHSGKVAIVFFPPTSVAAPTTLTPRILQGSKHVICDITLSNECEIEIPFCAPMAYLRTQPFAYLHPSGSYTDATAETCLGYLGVYVYEQLTTFSVQTQNIDIMYSVSAKNVAYSRPRKHGYNAVAQMADKTIILGVCDNKNNKQVMIENAGSIITNFRQLAKIKEFPRNNLRTFQSIQFDTWGLTDVQIGYLNHCNHYFQFHRGGIRIGILPVNMPVLAAIGSGNELAVHGEIKLVNGIGASPIDYTAATSSSNGHDNLAVFRFNHILEYEIPYGCGLLYVPNNLKTRTMPTNLDVRSALLLSIETGTLSVSTNQLTARVAYSYADDVNFAHYNAVEEIIWT